jgi:hypothetical protein
MECNEATERKISNTPIPPRSRAHCGADSPRRGEYGALGGRLRGAAMK